MATALDVQDLRTHLPTRKGIVKAVDGVSFHIDEGEIVGLVGESGCGKSETILSIVQLIQPPGKIVGGRVIIDGEDILQLKASSPAMRSIRGSKISFIFKDPKTSLNPTLAVSRQITEILETHLDMDKQLARERAVELLEMVGVPDAAARINDRPYQFSSGMRQKVMIAMALACNPMVVIADDPTAVADVTAQAQLFELMKENVSRLNTSLIIVTQNLGMVTRYARRVYVMYAGRIVESGPTEVVFNNPCHPYTLGLLRSLPRLGVNKSIKKLNPLLGLPPDLIDMPPYCPFLPRCTSKIERCEQEPWPNMRPVGEGHQIRCYVDLREIP